MLKNRVLKTAILSLSVNSVYGVYNIVLGSIERSWWLFTTGVYYLMLSALRFVIVITRKRIVSLSKFTGIMLIFISFLLSGTVVLAVLGNRGHKFDIITMITIATYAFTKITLSTIKLIKSRHSKSKKVIALRNVSFATAFVSIFSMQRSMLVTFEGMTQGEVMIMNAATGACVVIIVFLLGVNLVKKKKLMFKNMDK